MRNRHKLPNRLDLLAMQEKADEYNQKLVDDGKIDQPKMWRGEMVFTFGNRKERRHPTRPGVKLADHVEDVPEAPRCPRPSQHRKGVVHE